MRHDLEYLAHRQELIDFLGRFRIRIPPVATMGYIANRYAKKFPDLAFIANPDFEPWHMKHVRNLVRVVRGVDPQLVHPVKRRTPKVKSPRETL